MTTWQHGYLESILVVESSQDPKWLSLQTEGSSQAPCAVATIWHLSD